MNARMDAENYISLCSHNREPSVCHIWSEIDDSRVVAMATKSENVPITNTFGPGARTIQYEPVCTSSKVAEPNRL